jgi:hypothetical protein
VPLLDTADVSPHATLHKWSKVQSRGNVFCLNSIQTLLRSDNLTHPTFTRLTRYLAYTISRSFNKFRRYLIPKTNRKQERAATLTQFQLQLLSTGNWTRWWNTSFQFSWRPFHADNMPAGQSSVSTEATRGMWRKAEVGGTSISRKGKYTVPESCRQRTMSAPDITLPQGLKINDFRKRVNYSKYFIHAVILDTLSKSWF